MTILVTGGAGYIGSHTCLALLESGYEIVVLDNLCNGSQVALNRVQELSGKSLRFIRGDIRNASDLQRAFSSPVQAVIHFAAFKAVEDSCRDPLAYFENYISGTISLLLAMREYGVSKLVFSSSATVYGAASAMPVTEDSVLSVTNPYGRSKLVMEQLIADNCAALSGSGAAVLRYFNPVGAHPSGRIGEDPAGAPANLMPYIAQVAVGRRDALRVFGGDYPTRDGTGVRDYLHVMDLAHAHVAALRYLDEADGFHVFNLGTGRGYSVLEVVSVFERTTGLQIPRQIVPRRPGDVAELWANPERAHRLLAWNATLSMEDMCRDAWRWQAANPDGYRSDGGP